MSVNYSVRAQAPFLVLLSLIAMLVAACSDGEDRPGSVDVIDDGGGVVSASESGSVSASGVEPSGGGEPTGLGAYLPASDVANHAMVSSDIADINALLGASPIDWAAVQKLYEEGEHSTSGMDKRTIAGFASNEGRSEAIWDDYTAYYGDQTWLDTFIMSAIDGTGSFAGESDAVRKQGAQKGIQNQTMVSWTLHELVAAIVKAKDGNFDSAGGAPHNWDEGWAFYHGVDPVNSAYSTADKRGGNFGTGTAVNDAILAAMNQGRDALVAGDAAAAKAAMDEVVKQIRITYLQASILYATLVANDLAEGETESARTHQAEGWAFFRVIEPMVAQADAAVATEVAGYYDLAAAPAAASDPAVRDALESILPAWGISAAEIGTLQ